MKLSSLIQSLGAKAAFLSSRKGAVSAAPALGEPVRFPYGPFRFRTRLPKGAEYVVIASTDLRNWLPITRGSCSEEALEIIDSDAFKFSYRFYRVVVGGVPSANVIGYCSVTLPPGFSMIAHPFENSQTVSEIFKDWPDGTTFNRFDTRLFRLVENGVKSGKWAVPDERLLPGEGAIFFNPSSDYKSTSFVGEVLQGHLSIPVPAGFSIRSSLVPQPGNLDDDLHFPVAEGDVIHLFDREQQKYMLHPFENGKWVAGPPILSVGESFWVAKTQPGNWIRSVTAEGAE
jgi:hypothetical protein